MSIRSDNGSGDFRTDTPTPATCANCGGTISQTDVICPHCGESLAGG